MRCKMQIIIDQLEPYRERYPLWSVLFVQIDEVSFPDEHWWDATSSVLSIWLANIYKLLCGIQKSVILPFMDGDYSIELTWQSHELAYARCLGPNKIIMLEQEIDLVYLVRQMLSAVGKIEKQYAEHLKAYQLSELSELAQKLQGTLKKNRR